ncbi:MAG: META domain-containing protein [Treponema sp.]|nr:META domain-containing protein [Treponema sp.]
MTVIAGIFTASCSSTREGPPADQAPRPEFRAVVVQPDFSDAIGKEWYLVEIQTPSGPAKFSRAVLEAHGMGDCYTLRFDQERLAGKGAPNRYTAPYQLGKDAAISIQAIAGTLMTSLSEPPGLGEQEYYNYLERVSRWNLEEDTLNLYTRNTSDELMILVYQLRRE